jgi:DNA-binding PadR family transcriptional regulator
LSLLAERPMHGYQANLELERRRVRDWAGISRPQIYYSLDKLLRLRLLRRTTTRDPVAGPERYVFATTASGRKALADGLEKEDWTTCRDRPPFLTWVALSWQARPGVFEQQILRRRRFLNEQLAREQATLRDIIDETGHRYHEAVWMVSLTIDQFKAELRWLQEIERELRFRRPARGGAVAIESC